MIMLRKFLYILFIIIILFLLFYCFYLLVFSYYLAYRHKRVDNRAVAEYDDCVESTFAQ